MSSTSLLQRRFTTTVAKELAVGVSGIILVVFILGHLIGNLLLLFGPEAFNEYAERLHSLGELLWMARAGLLVAFVVHVGLAINLAKENAAARGGGRYHFEKSAGRKTFATRLMLISGVLIFFFVLFHIYDFSITADRTGEESFVDAISQESLGLYGVVYNAFGDPVRSLIYILAVCFVGIHLSHAIASVVVTLGFLAEKNTTKAEYAARAIGLVVAVGFSIIPLYVMFRTYTGV